jgi:hypothetical protein
MLVLFSMNAQHFYTLFSNKVEEDVETKKSPKDYTDAFLG